MLCSRCGKNIAVVFLGDGNNPAAPTQALCVTCARELGIPQVDKMIQQLGLDPEEIEKEMNALMENMDDMDLEELENMNPTEMMEKLLGETGDVAVSHLTRMNPRFDGIVFGGQTVGIKAHREQNVVALHSALT